MAKMILSIKLSPEEETLLEQTARQLGRNKSDLVRQAIHGLCRKQNRGVSSPSPYSLGEDLFGIGKLAATPSDPMKERVCNRIHKKHL